MSLVDQGIAVYLTREDSFLASQSPHFRVSPRPQKIPDRVHSRYAFRSADKLHNPTAHSCAGVTDLERTCENMVKVKVYVFVIQEDAFLQGGYPGSISASPKGKKFMVPISNPEEWVIGQLAIEIKARYRNVYHQ